jgi:hypothetical protein
MDRIRTKTAIALVPLVVISMPSSVYSQSASTIYAPPWRILDRGGSG